MWVRSWTSCGWFRITYLAVPGIIFSAYHTVQFFRLQKINGKSRTAVYVDVRSCFRHLLRNNTRTRTPWCIADCLSFFLVTQSFSPHRWLVTFLKNFFSAGRVRVHTCCECYNKRGYIRTWYVYKIFFFFSVWWDIPASAFFTLGRSVSAWIDYSTTKWNRQTRQQEGKRPTWSPVYVHSLVCLAHVQNDRSC